MYLLKVRLGLETSAVLLLKEPGRLQDGTPPSASGWVCCLGGTDGT